MGLAEWHDEWWPPHCPSSNPKHNSIWSMLPIINKYMFSMCLTLTVSRKIICRLCKADGAVIESFSGNDLFSSSFFLFFSSNFLMFSSFFIWQMVAETMQRSGEPSWHHKVAPQRLVVRGHSWCLHRHWSGNDPVTHYICHRALQSCEEEEDDAKEKST